MAIEHRARREYVPKVWGLPIGILRRLGDEPGRQRLMMEDGELLLILHSPPRPEDGARREAVLFWQSASGEWKSSPEAGGLTALEAHVARFQEAVAEEDRKVESAEDSRAYYHALRALQPLHRSARNLLAVLQELREARPDERRILLVRDAAVGIERMADLAIGDARVGLDFSVAEGAEQQAEAGRQATEEARRLNRLAAMFLPAATMAALLSINAPDQMWRMPGFGTLLGVGLLAGFGCLAWISRPHPKAGPRGARRAR